MHLIAWNEGGSWIYSSTVPFYYIYTKKNQYDSGENRGYFNGMRIRLLLLSKSECFGRVNGIFRRMLLKIKPEMGLFTA